MRSPTLYRSRPGLMLGGLAAVLAAALVAVGFLAFDLREHQGRDDTRQAAVAVARQFVANFTTIDHESFERDSDRLLQLAAGSFRQEFSGASTDLAQMIVQNKTVTQGEVIDAGVAEFEGESARVLVAADATVSNVLTEKPERRYYRFVVDLVVDDGDWRVVDLRPVG